MKDRSEIGIDEATARYESWLAGRIPLVQRDLEAKHRAMSAGIFPFFRATFYRWADRWRALAGDVAAAPTVLAVGDLHVENFGTWRDAEGRLVWGVNDFDEAWPLPYTNDLARLATSALVAREYHDLRIDGKEAVSAILDGYREALEKGGHAFVLAEHHTALREMAMYRLHDPETFWHKLESLPTVKAAVPEIVLASLRRALPERGLKVRIVHRVAGLGSLGRQRFVALAVWRGGRVAREAKALAPSACTLAANGAGETGGMVRRAVWVLSGATRKIHYDAILRRGVRCPDPCVKVDGAWLVRRLAPDCSRVKLNELPRKREETRLLSAMGWETANVHLGSPGSRAIRADLKRRDKHWLYEAARRLADAIDDDWRDWCKGYP
ncbi:MAG: hypothetical protein DMD60_05760 [Gemmatimonadetes bacterium]|nr:MAG: hypothetical protein DMD60_05760 [Gemmatimonadota bacterium]